MADNKPTAEADADRGQARRLSGLLVTRSFCELVAAGCVEVGCADEQQRSYRAVAGLDLTLLDAVERVIISCLQSFSSFQSLLRTASEAVEKELPAAARPLTPRDAALWREAGATIDDALEYHPPATSCSV